MLAISRLNARRDLLALGQPGTKGDLRLRAFHLAGPLGSCSNGRCHRSVSGAQRGKAPKVSSLSVARKPAASSNALAASGCRGRKQDNQSDQPARGI